MASISSPASTAAPATPSTVDMRAPDPPTWTRTLASGPSPSMPCDSIYGSPLLPPLNSNTSYRCGTRKSSNKTLMSSCCNGARVQEYLGCFWHCEIEDFSYLKMQDFAECLSGPGNETEVDRSVFCQGNLNSTISASSATFSVRRASKSWGMLATIALIALLGCESVSADCLVTLKDDSVVIRQEQARGIGSGIRCPNDPCLGGTTGLGTLESAATRSIDGTDASQGVYDEFFDVLGQTTDPPRLFAASANVEVDFWSFGDAGNSGTWPQWAPLSYCVNATASDCSEVEGTVEACGPLYQNDATGLEEDAVVQGVVFRTTTVPTD